MLNNDFESKADLAYDTEVMRSDGPKTAFGWLNDATETANGSTFEDNSLLNAVLDTYVMALLSCKTKQFS